MTKVVTALATEDALSFPKLMEKPESELTPTEAAFILYIAERAKTDFATFCYAVSPGYQFPHHIQVMCATLNEIEHTPDARVMVTCPPRHGKSFTCSTLYPAWYLGKNPDKKMITASYIGGLTSTFASQVRDTMESKAYGLIFPGVKIKGKARGSWGIQGHKGGLMATGVTSSMTGFGADIMIIDDPIRDAMYADSPAWRQHLWDWFTSTAYTRLHPGAPVFVIATRWHWDDLSGRLIEQGKKDEDADQWFEIYFPAINDKGEALWPERYDVKKLQRIKATVGSRVWNALYQGRPTPDEGNLFKRWMFRKVLKLLPTDKTYRFCRFWDKAGTADGGDWTAGVLMAIDEDNNIYICHVVHGQWSALEREQIIRATAEMDQEKYGKLGKYSIGIEQEPGSGGLESAQNTIRRLAGFRAKAEPPKGSLEVRADMYAAYLEAGNGYMLAGDWNEKFIDEHCQFPLGEHDDQISAAAGAFGMLTGLRSFKYALLG